MKQGTISPYQALGNAVVLRAVKDYRAMHRKYKKHPENVAVKRNMVEIEQFFQSEYFSLFTDLDGAALLMRIKRDLEGEG